MERHIGNGLNVQRVTAKDESGLMSDPHDWPHRAAERIVDKRTCTTDPQLTDEVRVVREPLVKDIVTLVRTATARERTECATLAIQATDSACTCGERLATAIRAREERQADA